MSTKDDNNKPFNKQQKQINIRQLGTTYLVLSIAILVLALVLLPS